MSNKEKGKCPYCSSEDIEYSAIEIGDWDMVYYPCHCNKCGKEFNEAYHLEYDGMFDKETGKEL